MPHIHHHIILSDMTFCLLDSLAIRHTCLQNYSTFEDNFNPTDVEPFTH